MTQIFLSYARDDDLLPPNLPPGKQASGFVTALHNQLLYEFRNQGGERPELWHPLPPRSTMPPPRRWPRPTIFATNFRLPPKFRKTNNTTSEDYYDQGTC